VNVATIRSLSECCRTGGSSLTVAVFPEKVCGAWKEGSRHAGFSGEKGAIIQSTQQLVFRWAKKPNAASQRGNPVQTIMSPLDT
jgi:hypothetical protein